jgi:hypothetical protein
MMLTHMISLLSLALLCGMAWHNRPARKLDRQQQPEQEPIGDSQTVQTGKP